MEVTSSRLESATGRLEERREKWLDAFERVYQFVPLSHYDEVTKLAHYAFDEMIGEIARLRDELSRYDWDPLAREALAK